MDKKDELTMLHEAVSEIAILLQDSQENPVSLSLYLLDMGVKDSSVKDKLIKKVTEMVILSDKDPMELTAMDFQKEFHQITHLIPDDPDEPAPTVYILKWIGLHLMPRVYPVAINIE